MAIPRPKDVVAQQTDKVLEITWDDGHVSRYDWKYLRGHCPCAGCQGHGGEHTFYSLDGMATELKDMGLVGGYALSMAFADGHASGIYSYEHLLKICPCEDHGGPGYHPDNLLQYKS